MIPRNMSLVGKSLCVLTPVYDGILTVNFHESMMALSTLCKELEVLFDARYVYNESLISRARNRLTDTYVKETSFTHACFIDADIGFNPHDIRDMLSLDQDIMGVPCAKKFIRWDRIQIAIARRVLEWSHGNALCQNGHQPQQLAEAYMQSNHSIDNALLPKIGGDFVLNLLPGTEDGIFSDLYKLEPMRSLGTGLLMVKREVFLKFMKAYPDRWYESKDPTCNPGKIHDFFKVGVHPETREYLSEDYWFIHDCIALGYKALLYPRIQTTHMGRTSFQGDLGTALAASGGKLF
jgi:hypothetical protein